MSFVLMTLRQLQTTLNGDPIPMQLLHQTLQMQLQVQGKKDFVALVPRSRVHVALVLLQLGVDVAI